jgi:hypothetical protein
MPVETKGFVAAWVVALCFVPLLALAQAAPPGPAADAPAPTPPVEPAKPKADEGDADDLCPRQTGSRVLQAKPAKGSHAGCVNHGWSYGAGQVPSDGDMGSALQQLSPAIF